MASKPKSRAEVETQWLQRARRRLVNQEIVGVSYMTLEESEQLGWPERALVLELKDKTLLYASRDPEGNGPGALFGQGPDNEFLNFPPMP